MKHNQIVFLLLFHFVLFIPLYAQQSNDVDSVSLNELDTLSNRANQEIAYIQTDKDIYETGEEIWFKIYLLEATNLTPSTKSKTLFVELYNGADNKIVWQEKYQVNNSFPSGSIPLERTLSEGDYILVVYTPFSFFSNTKDLYQVKRIRINENVIPKVPFNVCLNKKYNSSNDSIEVFITPSILIKDSLIASIQISLENGRKIVSARKLKTDGKGYCKVSFPPINQSSDFLVNVVVKYKNKEKKVRLPVNYIMNSIQFDLFPEGGYLIDGIPCKMAFKAVDLNGEPLEIKGKLFENGSPLREFKSVHYGMGFINFTPQKSNKYFIRIEEPAIDTVFNLPEIQDKGISLQLITNAGNYVVFKIINSINEKKSDLVFKLQSRGEIYYQEKISINREVTLKVPVDNLPIGIVEATVYDYQLRPVAERLVFINIEKKLNIKVTLSNDNLFTKERVGLKILVTDDKGYPVITNMGISIYEKMSDDTLSRNNILSYYQLSTQIKGKIHNPSYYFNPKNKNRKAAIDLLMLTQGWRRYVWNEKNIKSDLKTRNFILWNDVRGEIFYPDKTPSLMGNSIIEVFSSDPSKGVITIIVDSNKRSFTCPNETLINWQNTFFYLRLLVFNENYSKIRIHDPFETISKVLKENQPKYYIPYIPNDSRSNPVVLDVNSPGVTSLKTIIFSSRKKNEYKPNELVGDYVCMQNVLNCPRHVFEFNYRRPIIGKKYFVNTFVNTKQEKVYTITYPYIPEDLVSKISQPTLSDDVIKEMKNYIVKGFYKGKDYYKPNYDEVKEELSIPDYRKTILWEPNIVTNTKGEASVSFYCSDISSVFVGKIEGVGENEFLGSEGFIFNVTVKK